MSVVIIFALQLAMPPQVGTPAIPRFEDFRVPTPISKRKDIAIIASDDGGPTETPDHFKKRIRDAAKGGPDFAGHYTVVKWTCGSNCAGLAITDVLTGAVYDTPFMLVTGGVYVPPNEVISYRLDSNLLIIKGSVETPSTESNGPWGTFYYRWDGRRLILIRSVPGPRFMAPNSK
jgi:hypothetical protein